MSEVEVIAELGVNADGETGKAIWLVDAAKEAGADCVKFQASFLDQEISRRYANGDFERIAKVLLPHGQIEIAAAHAVSIGLPWLCTPAESKSLAWMMDIGADRIKVSSDNLTNLPFLRDVAQCGKTVILSTGMATLEEIASALYLLLGYLPPQLITVLHCTSAYPCPIEDANLNAITTLKRSLPEQVSIGWSDHTTSLSLPAVAVGLGAVVIEKHLTLDRKAPGPDHAASLEPNQFSTMVRLITEAKSALGNGVKKPRPSEAQCIQASRKSIVAAKPIAEGEPFTADNLAVKRPGMGRSPLGYFIALGEVAMRNYEQDEMIE